MEEVTFRIRVNARCRDLVVQTVPQGANDSEFQVVLSYSPDLLDVHIGFGLYLMTHPQLMLL